jgi:4-hydroxybenzoate polyprenyltransferase
MINNFVRLFKVSRPISWINTTFPFAAGYLMLGGHVDAHFIIGTLFFLIPYNLLMYGVNDVFDYESDMRNPRKGGIEGAVESKKYHKLILWSATLSCVPFIAAMALLGTGVSFATLLVVVFFVVAYSLKGLRFKERPVLDSLTSSAHFVGPLVYALSLWAFPAEAWPYVIAFFLWGMASHAFGAVQDIVPDREGNLASIATVFGARWTVRFSLALYLLSCFVLALTGLAGIVVALAGLLYVFNCLPYVHLSDNSSARANAGWRRFIWLNLVTGAVVTITLIVVTIA